MAVVPYTARQLEMAATRLRMRTRNVNDRHARDAYEVAEAYAALLHPAPDPRRALMHPSIMTFTGLYFDFEDPESFDWNITDIAQGLSNQCRFTGQSNQFLSLAQHSCLAADTAEQIDPIYAFEALMHDAHEAFYGDMATPLKILCPDYRALEKRGEAAMRAAFKLPLKMSPVVKTVDTIQLGWEKREQMSPETHNWEMLRDVLHLIPGEPIEPWAPPRAREEFLGRFRRLSASRPVARIPASTDEADSLMPVSV